MFQYYLKVAGFLPTVGGDANKARRIIAAQRQEFYFPAIRMRNGWTVSALSRTDEKINSILT